MSATDDPATGVVVAEFLVKADALLTTVLIEGTLELARGLELFWGASVLRRRPQSGDADRDGR